MNISESINRQKHQCSRVINNKLNLLTLRLILNQKLPYRSITKDEKNIVNTEKYSICGTLKEASWLFLSPTTIPLFFTINAINPMITVTHGKAI